MTTRLTTLLTPTRRLVRLARAGMVLFMALAIALAALAPAVSPAQAAACTQYYTVKRGDSLYSIGLKFGVSWRYLADLNDIANPRVIYTGQRLCVSTEDDVVEPEPQLTPTFRILSVVKDKSVTIQTSNFPEDDAFTVRMGYYGTAGVGGIKVATWDSGAGGTRKATFTIPEELAGQRRIAIRLQSPTSGYFAYNWFYNSPTGTNIGGGGIPGYTGYPTFSIASVVRNDSVTIRTKNLPKNMSFVVLMGKMGTRGIGGYKVATIDSGAGGAQTLTFDIPAELVGLKQIAIRMENRTGSGYFAYNWFYNSN